MNPLKTLLRWSLRALYVLVWWPFFWWFRGIFLVLACLLIMMGLDSALLKVADKADLVEVNGTYTMPHMLGADRKGTGYPTTVQTADGIKATCSCGDGFGSNSSCLSSQSDENLKRMWSLRNKPVTVLMSRRAFYQLRPICYEIRSGDTLLLSYEQSRAKYLRALGRLQFYALHLFMGLACAALYVSSFFANGRLRPFPWSRP